jgi:hypothetical protein
MAVGNAAQAQPEIAAGNAAQAPPVISVRNAAQVHFQVPRTAPNVRYGPLVSQVDAFWAYNSDICEACQEASFGGPEVVPFIMGMLKSVFPGLSELHESEIMLPTFVKDRSGAFVAGDTAETIAEKIRRTETTMLPDTTWLKHNVVRFIPTSMDALRFPPGVGHDASTIDALALLGIKLPDRTTPGAVGNPPPPPRTMEQPVSVGLTPAAVATTTPAPPEAVPHYIPFNVRNSFHLQIFTSYCLQFIFSQKYCLLEIYYLHIFVASSSLFTVYKCRNCKTCLHVAFLLPPGSDKASNRTWNG